MIWEIFKLALLLILLYVGYKFAVAFRRQKQWEAQGVEFTGAFAFFKDAFDMFSYADKFKHKMVFVPLFERL